MQCNRRGVKALKKTVDHIVLKSISKKYGAFNALIDVNLAIRSGVSFALLGPNGSGKSTLLKGLVGSIPFNTGEIDVCGQNDVRCFSYKKNISYMPQYPGFLPNLCAKDSIELLVQLRGQNPIHKDQLIDELGISHFWKKSFKELSGGMKQKINILQCFMFESKVIFLDEPTSSLDPHMASYVKSLIRIRKEQGNIILFTSHIMSEVEEIADRMALLSDGKILLEVSPKEFIQQKGAKNLEEAMLDFWNNNKN